jgi:hypothetical protein
MFIYLFVHLFILEMASAAFLTLFSTPVGGDYPPAMPWF